MDAVAWRGTLRRELLSAGEFESALSAVSVVHLHFVLRNSAAAATSNMNSAVFSAVKVMGKSSVAAFGARRTFAASGGVHPGYKKIKAKYAQFQVEDNTPIHLKGGAFDRMLYMSTIIMCGVGVAGCFEYYYSASFPKKE